MPTTASILAIDDQPESLEALRVALRPVPMRVRGPWAVDEADLIKADLIVVDLKLPDWDERGATGVLAAWPDNGQAVIGNLRGHLERLEKTRPTSFALQSSYLDEVWGGLPPEYRAHALAHVLNLEWIFAKTAAADEAQLSRQLIALARATRTLPASWPQGNYDATKALVAKLLGLSTRFRWFAQAWEDVERCHPPVHDLVAATHGTVFIRWLLHRILPYPCFLWDEQHLGARLGLVPQGLAAAIADKPALHQLESARYGGVLADFLGPRWWRTGIETVLWRITKGASSDLGAVRVALTAAGLDHPELAPGRRTICIDESFRPLAAPATPSEAIRIQPDDWPSYADPAWTTLELARGSAKLRALVLSEDRDRLSIVAT
jgi:CheY-like chemotaxis protein